MTLPDTPFVCENIDVISLRSVIWHKVMDKFQFIDDDQDDIADAEDITQDIFDAVIAALGEVIPAEVDYSNPLPGEPRERYRTEWRPA
jgi:hypothetical protein